MNRNKNNLSIALETPVKSSKPSTIKAFFRLCFYLFVRIKIVIFSSVAPLSFLHIIVRVYGWLLLALDFSQPFPFPSYNSVLITLADLILLGESLFYLYYRRSLYRLERYAPLLQKDHLLSPQERWPLFEQTISTISDIRQFICGWYHNAPFESVRRENLKDFLVWAFFMQDYEQNFKYSATPEEQGEVDKMIEHLEKRFGIKFEEGRSRNVKCMRLTCDPLSPRHRPLFYYLILFALQILFSFYMSFGFGFTKYHSKTAKKLLLGRYPAPSPSSPHSNERINYWFRPADRNVGNNSQEFDCTPVVFIHGIGVGIFGYSIFFKKLFRERHRPFFIIEMPHVSSMLFPFYRDVLEDIPTRNEMVEAIETMLYRHLLPSPRSQRIGKVDFVGHSLGTTIVTWLIKLKPHLVRRAIFLDPVCFLLHYPYVAYNFIYRQPKQSDEWLIWFFASRELYVSWVLGRCFFWHHNVLFLDDIPATIDTTIVIGGSDCIVPTAEVVAYMRQNGASFIRHDDGTDFYESEAEPESPSPTVKSDRLHIHYYPTLTHAQFLFRPDVETQIVQIIAQPFTRRRSHPNSLTADPSPERLSTRSLASYS